MSFLNSVQFLINRIGNEKISKITVNRTPLSKVLKFLLNLTSLGQVNDKLKNTPYDTLYHLFMVITTSSGSYVVEKNEVIKIYRFNSVPKGTETLFVPSDDGLTLNIMINKTKNVMREKFFTYQPTNNNCQEFILQLLVSNGLNTDVLEEFVIQDVGKLFENNPQFRKIVTTVTDTGSIASTALDKYQTNELLRKPSTGYTLFSSSNTKFNNILNRSIPEFFRNSFSRLI